MRRDGSRPSSGLDSVGGIEFEGGSTGATATGLGFSSVAGATTADLAEDSELPASGSNGFLYSRWVTITSTAVGLYSPLAAGAALAAD
jgi:hypothetical protein